MTNIERLEHENSALRERLARLSEASLRISESLDIDSVLTEVVDGARTLTHARYGALTVSAGTGEPPRFFSSGLTAGEHRALVDMPDGARLFEHFTTLTNTLRIADLRSHARSHGLPLPELPVPMTALMVAPIRHAGVAEGSIYVTGDGSRAFTRADEDALVMFASQAALAIANARRYMDEQRARADLEVLINTSPVGVAVFDVRTGKPISFNDEAVRILGALRLPERPAQDLLDALSVTRADGRRFMLGEFSAASALRTGETIRAEEIVLAMPDGSQVTTLVNSTPIYSQGGEVESVIVTMQDMSALGDLERLRVEFLAMVSHELRTPLAAIKGSAATLLEASPELDAAEVRQFHRVISVQADRMRELISDLLDVAHIASGTLSVNPEPSDLITLVDHAKSAFLSGGGSQRLEIDVPQGLPPVMADRRRVVQVVSNLIANAARHSHESGSIRVTAVEEGLHVAVSVIDQGRGIAPERLPHLFSKFSRTERDREGREIESNGLGLAICKGIVEAHGGRIRAESEGHGLGARFTFTLPTVDEPAHRATPSISGAAAQSADATADRVRILAVDDDPLALRHIREVLLDAGYDPIVTADADEALLLTRERQPDLALLDLVLPEMDGVELMEEMLDVTDVPVIFVSAYGRDENIERAFEMGAYDYVVKPFSPTELVARITAALRRRAALDDAGSPTPYQLRELTVDFAQREVHVGGHAVHLTPIEFALLHALSAGTGSVMTHAQLLRRVWGPGNSGDPQLVRTHMRRLRRKLGDDADNPTYIFTEPGVGYRMPKGEERGRA